MGRAIRLVNFIFVAWVIAAPLILRGATPVSKWSDPIAAALVILLSFRRGPVGESYGTWARFIR